MINKKILYFAPCGLNEGVGGSGRLNNMINILSIKYNIILISYINSESRCILKNEGNNLIIYNIYVNKKDHKFTKLIYLFFIFFLGIKYIKNINIIMSHSPSIVTGFPSLILSKLFHKPFIIDHMDVKDPDTPQFLFDLVLYSANAIFTISTNLYIKIREKKINNVFHIPIFIDTNIFKLNHKHRKYVRKKLKIFNKDVVIGYLGSFNKIEGIPKLITSFNMLTKKYENLKLCIIGKQNVPNSDNIKSMVDNLNSKNILLLPPINHKYAPIYLSGFDIACAPKIQCIQNIMANPIKIYEYMSMGLITVASSIGGIKNVIDHEINGFLVMPGSIKSLLYILDKILNNIDKYTYIKYNARNKILKYYSKEILSKKIYKIVDSL